ncbi:hypothetical protein EV715DRAFT_213944, partial [Schizophyllum commune]
FSTAARGFRRLVSLDVDASALQREAYRRDALEDEEDPASVADQRGADRMYASYYILLDLVPEVSDALSKRDGTLAKVLKDVQLKGNTARAEDFAKIKGLLASVLNAKPYECKPPLNALNRTNRGLKHDVTGELLCPIEYDWDQPWVREQVRDGEPGFRIGGSYFFYPAEGFDKADVTENFLLSPILVQMYQDVFTAPSSMETDTPDDDDVEEPPTKKPFQQRGEGRRATRTNVATGLNMRGKVTPRSIAYIAVLVHLNLTDANAWVTVYIGINYMSLYNFIIDFFEDHDPTTAVGTLGLHLADNVLQWWNKYVVHVISACLC